MNLAYPSTNGKRQLKESVLGQPKTASYEPSYWQFAARPRDLPPFTADMVRMMLLDSAVRLGLAMRAAPISGVEIAYEEKKDNWIPGVQAKRQEVGAYVYRQTQRIWAMGLEAIMSAQVWGWSSGEITYKLTRFNMVEVDQLLPRMSMDCRVLLRGGEKCGTRINRVKKADYGYVDLNFPKSWFHAFRPEAGMHYGVPILLGAYSPFADKWLHGGGLDVRRLFMHKDSYGGVDIAYPENTSIRIGDQDVSSHDLALQMAQQLIAGGVTTRPSGTDDKGKEKWTITRASVPSNPQHILQYPKDLDTEIYHGLEIPDDVIQSETTGAWAGKRIPMAAFYASLDSWVDKILEDLRVQVFEPGVMLNFGKAEDFAVTHKPLAKQAMEQQSQAAPGQQGQQGQQFGNRPFGQQIVQSPNQLPQMRMGLDPVEAVGEGVLSAAELVSAARHMIRMAITNNMSIGDRIKVKPGKEHDSITKDKRGIIQEISTPALGIRFDGMSDLHKWYVADELEPDAATIRMAVVHAPAGGINIAGKRFTGGEFIPGEDLKKATAEQRRQIEGGKQAKTKTGPSEKVRRAKSSAKRIAGDVQRYAEEHNEPAFAKNIGGASFRDNEPIDIVVADDSGRVAHGIELKTMVDNSNNKITMKGEAIRRKLSWARRNKAAIHTIVIDDSAVFNANGKGEHDESKRRYFYRRGVGSFRVNGMYEAKSIDDLRALVKMPTRQLPEGAK